MSGEQLTFSEDIAFVIPDMSSDHITSLYNSDQINGCRILELKKSQEPEKGSEIFVTNIPEATNETELLHLFSRIGVVHRVRLMVCFSGAIKGYAFIQFRDPKVVAMAVEKLNGYVIKNKSLRVVKSRDNCRLFFGKIPTQASRADIEREFRDKMSDIKAIFYFTSLTNPSENRGFLFVEFSSHRSAAIARRKFSKKTLMWGRKIEVDWATTPEEDLIDEEAMKTVMSVFLRCIPHHIKEQDIINEVRRNLQLSKYEVRIMKRRDYAIIKFNDRQTAELALTHLKEVTLKGYKFNVSWALPNNKRSMNKFTETLELPKQIKPEETNSQPMTTLNSHGRTNAGAIPKDSSIHEIADWAFFTASYDPYKALSLFIDKFGWGNIELKISTKVMNDVTWFIAQVLIPHAPEAIRMALAEIPLQKYQVSEWTTTQAIINAWKCILPHYNLPHGRSSL